jgi:hypothetical protein
MAKCIVLHSSKPYTEASLSILRKLLGQEPDLFAAVGVDCEGWEDAMDWLCVDLDRSGEQPGAFCNTTSHPNETLADVVEFAEQWCDLKGWKRDVEIIEI